MAKTLFLRSGSSFNVTSEEAIDSHETLPVGTYTVKFNERGGYYYLDTIDAFEVKGKIYGDTKRNTERILNTFRERTSSTGVMLSGEQGSGKTLLAKMLSIEAQKEGVPTIVINNPWHGEEFNNFMQMIEQPVVVIFDEFEKVYDREKQEKLLTLLDGVYPSKKLFILTCNDKWKVNEHMRNRPGRIYYRLEYTGLETDFISEYCLDNLDNKEHIATICRIAVLFTDFNFDMLKAMVEEMNRYGETPQEVMQVLNTKPESGGTAKYRVSLRVDGKDVETRHLDDGDTWSGNPLNRSITIYYNDGDDFERAEFATTDLQKIDQATGAYHFLSKGGEELTLSKVEEKTAHYWKAL